MKPSRTLSTLLGLTLATACLPATATAQEPRREGFGEELTVQEVLLDVLVTDGDGNVVIGLDEDDFVVEEAGEPVEVISASFYSNRHFLGGLDGGGPDDPALEGRPEARTFVLFFYRPPVALADRNDAAHYLRLPKAGKSAFRWIVEELLPDDWVAVVSYDTHLHLHHDLSRDRRRLGRAIERAAAGKRPQRWPSRSAEPTPGVSLGGLPEGEALRRETEEIHQAIATLATALGGVPGRKNLVLFGVDLPRLQSGESREGYPPMVEALNAHNVAAYTLGVSGRGRQATLERLAADTGGAYAWSFESFLEPLREIAVETSGYYLLAFESRRAPGETGYREVTVTTPHEGFRVRARRGYRLGE